MSYSKIHLEPDTFFHIYNHAITDENIFREDKDYPLFLSKVSKWIEPICDIFAYCLMRNHFHFVVRIKQDKHLLPLWQDKISLKISIEKARLQRSSGVDLVQTATQIRIQTASIMEKMISEQFSHCFNSYVQLYNWKYLRKGPLFQDSFQRIKIDSDEYLRNLICYVHNNPVLHGFTDDPTKWKYSSYNLFDSNECSFIMKNEVLEIFGDIENFHFVHRQQLTETLTG